MTRSSNGRTMAPRDSHRPDGRGDDRAHAPPLPPLGPRVPAGADGVDRPRLRRPRGSISSAHTRAGERPPVSRRRVPQLLLHDPCTGDYPPSRTRAFTSSCSRSRSPSAASPAWFTTSASGFEASSSRRRSQDGETPLRTIRTTRWAARSARANGPPGTSRSRVRSRPTGSITIRRSRTRSTRRTSRRRFRWPAARRGRSRRRWQRSADRQRRAGPARSPADHQGRHRQAARRPDAASRRHRRQGALRSGCGSRVPLRRFG